MFPNSFAFFSFSQPVTALDICDSESKKYKNYAQVE